MVVGDAASDIRAIDLELSRSPVVVSVPKEDRYPPYFYVTSVDWSDATHTTATMSVEIFDDYMFATPTCDLWVELRESESAPLHGVATKAHHDGRHGRLAVLSIGSGAPNPARQLSAANVTCKFGLPGERPVESTLIYY